MSRIQVQTSMPAGHQALLRTTLLKQSRGIRRTHPLQACPANQVRCVDHGYTLPLSLRLAAAVGELAETDDRT